MTRSEVAYALFHEMMQVDVSTRFIYPPEYTRKFPLSMHGNLEEEVKFQTGHTTVLRSTAGIAMLLDQGSDIYYKDMRQLVKSFQLVKAHLANWVEEMQTPFGRNPPPDEDLLMLNNLADHLAYAANRFILHEDLAERAITGNIDDDPFADFRGTFTESKRFKINSGGDSQQASAIYVSPLLEFWSSRGLDD